VGVAMNLLAAVVIAAVVWAAARFLP
jgi:hypothetical protein